MDIFNKKKVAELQRIIENQERALGIFRRKRDEENSGKHETGEWCEGCENCSSYYSYAACGAYTSRYCLLDNKCKDRKSRLGELGDQP